MNLDGLNPKNLLSRALTTSAATPLVDWAPPELSELEGQIPGVEIRQLLGRGGMGAVYLGHQSALARDVAVKILPNELAANPEFEDRFEREARALAKLNEPGIVTIYEVGESAGGFRYLVMEYVDGDSLEERLNLGPLPPDEARSLTIQIADAVAAAHAQGIVHRDLKPSNVLLTSDGQPKVTDFGIAKVSDDSNDVTTTGAVIGSSDYMAPEQRVVGSTVDARADVFGLGVLLFHLITGSPPIGAWTERLPNRTTTRVLTKALAQNPDDRFPDAAVFSASLRHATTTRRRWISVAAAGISATAIGAFALTRKRSTTSGFATENTFTKALENTINVSTNEFSLTFGLPGDRIDAILAGAREVGFRPQRLRFFRGQQRGFYAALWIQDSADWKAVSSMSPDELLELHQQLQAEGYSLVDFAPAGGMGFASAVWVRQDRPREHELVWIWSEDVDDEIDKRAAVGWRLFSATFRRDDHRWRHYLNFGKSEQSEPARFYAGSFEKFPIAEFTAGRPLDLCIGGPGAQTAAALWSAERQSSQFHFLSHQRVRDHVQACEPLAADGWAPISASTHLASSSEFACASVWQKK